MQENGKRRKAVRPVLSLCGFRCDLCLAYQSNIKNHPQNAQVLSDGWHTYFGFRIPPEEIECHGCSIESETTLDSACPVRPCVIARQFDNCAACENYICEKLTKRLIDFETIEKEYGKPIPKEDRRRFIFPYENAKRLSKLRIKNK